jgi:phosphoketolase
MKDTARQDLKIATIPVTLPFDMAVLNYLDRSHRVMDTIDRLPQTGDKGNALLP